jgi:undecaprenyl-diphosphatase
MTIASPRGASTAGGISARGWALAGLTLLGAAFLLGLAAAGEGPVRGDIEVARAIQGPNSGPLDTLAVVMSLVGDGYPAMVVLALAAVAVLIAAGRRDLAVFVGLAAALRAAGPIMKDLANSPRPAAESVAILEQADGLGYPSGHALGAALLYGALALAAAESIANKMLARCVQVAALLMIVLIALSRVRLGVHWPSDVVGGLLIGMGLICLLRAVAITWSGVRVRT